MDPYRGQQKPAMRWPVFAAGLFIAILAIGTARAQQDPSSAVNRDLPWLPADAIRLPDKNAQIEMQRQKAKSQSYEIANAERKKQIADDAARLVQLATELKAEIEKSNKDVLSLDLVRKSDTIEKLAHGVKEKMKLAVY